jgi:hypothetical protein
LLFQMQRVPLHRGETATSLSRAAILPQTANGGGAAADEEEEARKRKISTWLGGVQVESS